MSSYVLYITGPLACGKSFVSRYLASKGAYLVDLDLIGATVRDEPEVACALASTFGEGILDPDGLVIPARLSAKAFDSAEATAQMNAIMFPPILDRLTEIIMPSACTPCNNPSFLAVEFPLLPWCADYAQLADEVLFVEASWETRLRRALQRGMDVQDAQRRMALQPTNEEYRQVATEVLNNDCSLEELNQKLEELWEQRWSAHLKFSKRECEGRG